MSLSLALNNALTGLNVSQKSLAVLSQNIANVNTVGYSRQIVDQSARYVDGVGQGVIIEDVTRKIDQYLQGAIQRQTSEQSSAEVKNDYLERVQILFGQPGTETSLDQYVANFFDQLQLLGATPELQSVRNTTISSGVNLANQISGLAETLQGLRFQADQDISGAIKTVNDELTRLIALNVAINRSFALGSSTAGLLDQRDASIRKISEFLDVSVSYKLSGEVNLTTGTGISILDDSQYQLTYNRAPLVDVFIDGEELLPLQVQRLDGAGQPAGAPVDLISGGVSGPDIVSSLKSGKIRGLQQLRDKDLPDLLSQLDTFASVLRDELNAIHNNGSGIPGANSLTGAREVLASERSDWTGQVRIAVLDADGKPISSFYSDEAYTGVRPLTLDLASLDAGFGAGQPNVQAIVDEINAHFGIPSNKAELGSLNNIELVSNTAALPGAPPVFTFDFELDNIAAERSDFFVTGVTVLDSGGVNITSTSSTIPSLPLDPVNTFTTTSGSGVVRVTTAVPNTLRDGDAVFMQDPLVAVNGIPSALFAGYFVVSNVSATGYDISVGALATATGAVGVVGQAATPKWDTVDPGEKARVRDQGTITASLSGNPVSPFYTISVQVGVYDGTSSPRQATLTYQINNNEVGLRNDRYSVQAVTGSATLVQPSTTREFARALLVDADGVEIPKVNGLYPDVQAYLKIEAADGKHFIAIDELDSKQLGLASDVPPVPASNRAFSHYFGLNNFFKGNVETPTGDTIKNSALNLAVEERLIANPNIVTTGNLRLSNQPADPSEKPRYTYERAPGDNSQIQKIARLSVNAVTFPAASGFPTATQTFAGYTAQLLGVAASGAVSAASTLQNSETLLEGFTTRSDAISGVNLDEELANTIIYQNAYTASARVITTTNELFDALLNAF